MPKTARGIYHNLKESKYTISNSEVVFFFSSEKYMQKYLDGYRQKREENQVRFNRVIPHSECNMDMMSDIAFYIDVEKRGFRVMLKGVEMTRNELDQYGTRRMNFSKSLDWFKVVNPRTLERMEALS